ncbi:MAG: type II CAAX endopeptidase family protein [Phycisphaeraceae bacterium]|jgi:hypothetical protein|nr:type II CAAX endopeptidase family protein [Phycisphaeraceae bacterium]
MAMRSASRVNRLSAGSAFFALLLLVPAASFGTWVALVACPGTLGKTVFFLTKLWILLLPAVWMLAVDRRQWTLPQPSKDGMYAACMVGVLTLVIIAAAYAVVGRHWIDQPTMRARAHEINLDILWVYVLGAIYWCTINSILEEYVWRWFVFTRCEALVGQVPATIVSALLFTIHHVIALMAFFDWRVTILASLGVFIGSAMWSWLYLRYRNLWTAYVCHVFADVGIFVIGWMLIFW